jgi:hypothetical protein
MLPPPAQAGNVLLPLSSSQLEADAAEAATHVRYFSPALEPPLQV